MASNFVRVTPGFFAYLVADSGTPNSLSKFIISEFSENFFEILTVLDFILMTQHYGKFCVSKYTEILKLILL